MIAEKAKTQKQIVRDCLAGTERTGARRAIGCQAGWRFPVRCYTAIACGLATAGTSMGAGPGIVPHGLIASRVAAFAAARFLVKVADYDDLKIQPPGSLHWFTEITQVDACGVVACVIGAILRTVAQETDSIAQETP